MANLKSNIKQQSVESGGAHSAMPASDIPAKQQLQQIPNARGSQGSGAHQGRKGSGTAHGARDKSHRAPHIIGATELLAAKYPSYIAEDKDAKSKAETRVVLFVTAVILAFIAYGGMLWGDINFERTSEFTYNSGLIGGIMMLVVLTYAIRKRIKLLKKVGRIESWYYFHLIGGVLGPILIVFHSSFELKSINSSVALISMVLIVLSGLFGRYIYTRIGFNLHRKLLSIKNTEKALIESIRKYQNSRVEVIEQRLSTFALSCLAGQKVIYKLPIKIIAIKTAGAACYVKVSEDLTIMLQQIAQQSGWGIDVYKKLLTSEKQLLRKHINSVVEIAKIHHYERLLVKWRILHIPLLYILLVTGLAHVLAVHMY